MCLEISKWIQFHIQKQALDTGRMKLLNIAVSKWVKTIQTIQMALKIGYKIFQKSKINLINDFHIKRRENIKSWYDRCRWYGKNASNK